MQNLKGARTERELYHMLYGSGWRVVRAAGSGAIGLPCPDLIAGKNGRVLAIECKSGKATRYLTRQEVSELIFFAKSFGAEPYIGIRFDGEDWRFLRPEQLHKSGKLLAVSKKLAKNGLSFSALLSQNLRIKSR